MLESNPGEVSISPPLNHQERAVKGHHDEPDFAIRVGFGRIEILATLMHKTA
jgi:hypothetical protein